MADVEMELNLRCLTSVKLTRVQNVELLGEFFCLVGATSSGWFGQCVSRRKEKKKKRGKTKNKKDFKKSKIKEKGGKSSHLQHTVTRGLENLRIVYIIDPSLKRNSNASYVGIRR